MIIAIILLSLLCLLSLSLLGVATYRLFQYDTVMRYLFEDLKDMTNFLSRLVSRDMFSNSPEILAVHQGFKDMIAKLSRYNDVVSKRSVSDNLKMKDKPVDRRPVVID